MAQAAVTSIHERQLPRGFRKYPRPTYPSDSILSQSISRWRRRRLLLVIGSIPIGGSNPNVAQLVEQKVSRKGIRRRLIPAINLRPVAQRRVTSWGRAVRKNGGRRKPITPHRPFPGRTNFATWRRLGLLLYVISPRPTYPVASTLQQSKRYEIKYSESVDPNPRRRPRLPNRPRA